MSDRIEASHVETEEGSTVIDWEPSPQAEPPSIYANFIQLLAGPWDFTFRVGLIIFAGAKTRAREQVRILMSPQQGKALSQLLVSQVASYEARFGEIGDVVKVIGARSGTLEPTSSATASELPSGPPHSAPEE